RAGARRTAKSLRRRSSAFLAAREHKFRQNTRIPLPRNTGMNVAQKSIFSMPLMNCGFGNGPVVGSQSAISAFADRKE
ncbi:MAG TPA: hypothetical protein VMA13_10680, partial [Candidatus Saccharimonadales bacterium]|nr:hypothetical protein [Candidatus Saccharimonadales bacterium]